MHSGFKIMKFTFRLLLFFTVATTGVAAELQVYPPSVRLHHPKASQRIVVQYQEEVVAGQVIEGLKLEIENPSAVSYTHLTLPTTPYV